MEILLVKWKADPNVVNLFYKNVLLRALYSTNPIFELLLKHGANPNIKNKAGDSIIHQLARNGPEDESFPLKMNFLLDGKYYNDIDIRGQYGQTPLGIASFKRNINLVERLLKLGADVEATGHIDTTPLLQAASSCGPKMVKLLLDNGANINATDPLGNNAVARSYCNKVGNDEENLTLLLRAGGDVFNWNFPYDPYDEKFISIKVSKILALHLARFELENRSIKDECITIE